jgi:hypothetical protein
MAFDVTNLHLDPRAVGDLQYMYDAGSDTMATVIASGYFNNKDDAVNLAAEDLVWCQCSDGNMWLRVSSVVASTGVVTTQFAGGNLPINSAVGTASGSISMGYTEKNSGTASAHTLPTPYPGAEVIVFKTGTATAGQSFVTDATTVTLNEQGDRTITLHEEGEGFHLVGSSTTRWRIRQFVHSDAGAALS